MGVEVDLGGQGGGGGGDVGSGEGVGATVDEGPEDRAGEQGVGRDGARGLRRQQLEAQGGGGRYVLTHWFSPSGPAIFFIDMFC